MKNLELGGKHSYLNWLRLGFTQTLRLVLSALTFSRTNGPFHYRVNLDKKNEIYHHSQKEHLKYRH